MKYALPQIHALVHTVALTAIHSPVLLLHVFLMKCALLQIHALHHVQLALKHAVMEEHGVPSRKIVFRVILTGKVTGVMCRNNAIL